MEEGIFKKVLKKAVVKNRIPDNSIAYEHRLKH